MASNVILFLTPIKTKPFLSYTSLETQLALETKLFLKIQFTPLEMFQLS